MGFNDLNRPPSGLSFFPTLSFVHSLPPLGEWCREVVRSRQWDRDIMVKENRNKSARRRLSRIPEVWVSLECWLCIAEEVVFGACAVSYNLCRRQDAEGPNFLDDFNKFSLYSWLHLYFCPDAFRAQPKVVYTLAIDLCRYALSPQLNSPFREPFFLGYSSL